MTRTTKIAIEIAIVIAVSITLLLWLGRAAKNDYDYLEIIAAIKVGAQKVDRNITRLGKPDQEIDALPKFIKFRENRYIRQIRNSAYRQPDAGLTTHVLLWSGNRFSSGLTCFVGFDANEKVVTTGCGKK